MSFIQVTKEEFNTHAQQVSERSFMQTEEMVDLALAMSLGKKEIS